MADDSIPKVSINPAIALVNISRSFAQVNNTVGRITTAATNYKLAGDVIYNRAGGVIPGDKSVVYYTGSGGSALVLPSPSNRNKSTAPFVVVVNQGRGTVTVEVNNTGVDRINQSQKTLDLYVGRSALFIPDGQTQWSVWISGNSGDHEAYAHRGGSSLTSMRVAGCNNSTAFVTGNPAINTLRAMPFIAPQDNPVLDQVGLRVTTLLAGSARIGLYDSVSPVNLYPNRMLFDSGVIDTGTAGAKTVSVTPVKSLVPGNVYWLAHVCSSAATLQCLSLANCSTLLASPTSMDLTNVGISVAFTFAALGGIFPSGGIFIQAVPIPVLAARFAANTI